MPEYALKGAAIDLRQLSDRANRLRQVGLPIIIELHTFGPRDLASETGYAQVKDNIARLRDNFDDVRFVLHEPYQSVARVTAMDFDIEPVERAIAAAHALGCGALVMHRYWALVFGDAPARSSRADATAGFLDIVQRLARAAGDLRLLVENVGHYSLLPRDGRHFLSGPLDHFFPWEITEFRSALEAARVTNVEAFIDVAHATLSANLFNYKKRRLAALRDDRRFDWITDDDLARTDALHPFDFVDSRMPHLHLSDSLLLSQDALSTELDEESLTKAVTAEGLEIGAGNLPWRRLRERVGANATLVLEVEPGPDDSHESNGAQERSLHALREIMASNASIAD
ncbi:TIM barrel protein [Terrarubrum flagellatum]|uniref:TIM barrel protein n=1 Tax=Terrirubrum flagellatum TaxID=2895980 RepID=UPI0031456F86